MEPILIVDDNKDIQFNLSNILRDEGYEAKTCGNGREAIREVKTNSFNLVLLDIRLPGMDGMKVLEQMKKINKELSIIMLTAYSEIKDAVRAMKLGAFDYITKPFNSEELILTIKKALQTQSLHKEVVSLRKRLGEMATREQLIGETVQIKQVLMQIGIIAPTNMSVILQGESGTGKELVAQIIHQESTRKERPFVAIDCGAIPETLAESELFGYEKGAFTGAEAQREGKFEQAKGGTLLLDEVANLPDAIQAKLLRVIQERRLQHLGGKKDITVDVRIIVATNTNLSAVTKKGEFRNDLFHRLNEFNITIPPLRERKGDIPLLAKYFLEETNQKFNKQVKGFSHQAMEFLLGYHWSGNVRELRNVVRRAVLITESKQILPANLATEIINRPQNELNLTQTLDEKATFKEITGNLEKDLINKALDKTFGNKVKAAKILGLHRKELYRKMKRLGLPR